MPNLADQEVKVGVRPEGFILNENGKFCCELNGVEVMGRDISVVSTNVASDNPFVRSIISAENRVNTASKTVRFDLKPNKVFIFHKYTEKRIDI